MFWFVCCLFSCLFPTVWRSLLFGLGVAYLWLLGLQLVAVVLRWLLFVCYYCRIGFVVDCLFALRLCCLYLWVLLCFTLDGLFGVHWFSWKIWCLSVILVVCRLFICLYYALIYGWVFYFVCSIVVTCGLLVCLLIWLFVVLI